METLEALRRKIDSAKDLRSVVKTMKALAAVNIQHFREAVTSLAEYYRAVEMGLHVALRSRPEGSRLSEPPKDRRLGAVIIGSDQGMVGQFNEQLAHYALDEMNGFGVGRQDRAALAVGTRLLGPLEDAGQPVDDVFPVPVSVAGITPMAQDILLRIDEWHSELGLDRVVLFYNRPISSTTYRPHSVQILPVNPRWLQELARKPWPGRTLPAFRVEWNRLFSALIRQYLLVSVYRAVVESLASENQSRVAAMQAAEKNIEDRLHELNRRYHLQRQDSITEELLDIVGGFEALGGVA